MALSNPRPQHVSRLEARLKAEDERFIPGLVNQGISIALGTVAGAALGGIGTAFMGAKVAEAGLGAAGNVVGGVARGGIWGVLGVAATTLGLNTETGSQIVSTSTGIAKNIVTWGPRLMIGGGAVAGGLGGHLLASSRNSGAIISRTSEILADNRSEIASVERARDSQDELPQVLAANEASKRELGTMRPGSSPRRQISTGGPAPRVIG